MFHLFLKETLHHIAFLRANHIFRDMVGSQSQPYCGRRTIIWQGSPSWCERWKVFSFTPIFWTLWYLVEEEILVERDIVEKVKLRFDFGSDKVSEDKRTLFLLTYLKSQNVYMKVMVVQTKLGDANLNEIIVLEITMQKYF